MHEETSKEFITNLIDLVKNLKINGFSFLFNEKNIHIDFKNIDKYSLDDYLNGKITISKKYFQIFNKTDEFTIQNFFNLKEHFVINKEDKLIDFYISGHAKIQFIKRTILFLKNYGAHPCLSNNNIKYENITSVFLNNLELYWNICNHIKLSNEVNAYIINMMKNSKHADEDKFGNVKDRKAFKKRDDKYAVQVERYMSFPYLFTINSHKIMTSCELYTDQANVQSLNAIANDKEQFFHYMNNKIHIPKIKI